MGWGILFGRGWEVGDASTGRAAPVHSAAMYHQIWRLVSYSRAELYGRMARDLKERGAAFLKGGKTLQSLALSDLFDVKNGAVVPRLKAADPPVRANVLYLDPEFAAVISKAVKEVFLPYFDQRNVLLGINSLVIWFQNSSIYRFSMFHASHHLEPIVATEDEIEAEVDAVKRVADDVCRLKIALDRVVLTSTAVLLGLWQVESGTDPADIRSKLREALPRAPQKQLVRTAQIKLLEI